MSISLARARRAPRERSASRQSAPCAASARGAECAQFAWCLGGGDSRRGRWLFVSICPRPAPSRSPSFLLQGRQGKGEEGRHGSSVSSSPVSHLARPRFPRLLPTRATRDSLRRQDFFFNEPAQRCGRMARSVRLEAAGGDSRRQRELFFHLGQFAPGAASTRGSECVQFAWWLASPPFLRRSPAPDGRGGEGKGEEGSHGPSISSPPVPPSGSPRFRRPPPARHARRATRRAPRATRRRAARLLVWI